MHMIWGRRKWLCFPVYCLFVLTMGMSVILTQPKVIYSWFMVIESLPHWIYTESFTIKTKVVTPTASGHSFSSGSPCSLMHVHQVSRIYTVTTRRLVVTIPTLWGCMSLALIAGRLVYICRQIQALPNFTTDSNYNRASRAASIILESGLVYCVCIVLIIVLHAQPVVLDAMPQLIVSNWSYKSRSKASMSFPWIGDYFYAHNSASSARSGSRRAVI